jgi:hypothetical protein
VRLEVPTQLRSVPLNETALSTRARNSLLSGGIQRLGELHGLTDEQIASLPNIGTKIASEIIAFVSEQSVDAVSFRRPADAWIQIPTHLHSVDIRELALSTRAQNALLFNGISTLGELDGSGTNHSDGLRLVGPTARAEINEAISAFLVNHADSSTKPADSRDVAAQVGEGTGEACLAIPGELSQWPVDVLSVRSQLNSVLLTSGVDTLRKLSRLSLPALGQLPGIGSTGVAEIQAAIETFLAKSAIRQLAPLNGKTDPSVRRLRSRVLAALLPAETARQEVQALLEGLSPRDAEMIHARWTRVRGHQRSLDAIAKAHGITRERVRQIVTRHDERLSQTGIRLPECSRIISLLEDAGGLLPRLEFRALLKKHGVTASRPDLDVLQSLSELGLIAGRLRFVDDYGLWLSEKGITEWLESGRLEQEMSALRSKLNDYVDENGAVHLQRLQQLSPFGNSLALSLIPNRQNFIQVGDYLVRTTGRQSIRALVLEMLAVTPELTMSELHAGLSQLAEYGNLPAKVITGAICRDSSFELEGDRVKAASAADLEDSLSPSERAAITVIEQAGGLVLWSEFVEGIERHGFSKAMAAVLLKKPFIVRKSTAIYGLRGRPVPPQLLRQKSRIRAAARRESVIGARWLGVDRFEVRYRLSYFTLQGVLYLPADLGSLKRSRWTGRLPSGEEIALRSRNHLLWSLRGWLESQGASVGDVLVATFYVAEGRVELNDIISTGG